MPRPSAPMTAGDTFRQTNLNTHIAASCALRCWNRDTPTSPVRQETAMSLFAAIDLRSTNRVLAVTERILAGALKQVPGASAIPYSLVPSHAIPNQVLVCASREE
jgi:hypothetical protein